MTRSEIHIVFFSDTHLGFDYPKHPRIERRRRGEDFFLNFERVLSYAINFNVDLVVHGGDLFFRSKVPDFIVHRVYQSLLDFANQEISLYIVPGNHERSQLPSSLFLNHPYLNIFNEPKTYILHTRNATISLSGFPFKRESIRDQFKRILNRCRWYERETDINLLCMHQAIEGATVGPGNFIFKDDEDVIPVHLLPGNADAILCGHIHRQQILVKKIESRTSEVPLIFAGSTERTSFAEMNEKKGFYHIFFRNVENSGWIIENLKFIELPVRPMNDIFFDQTVGPDNLESFLKTKTADLDKNTILRFRSYIPISGDLVSHLTSKRMRQILPSSMNFTFGTNFFSNSVRG